MTAVMRAVSLEAAKAPQRVLRIAQVVDKRIVLERIVRAHGAVTVGTSERATFSVAAEANMPKAFALFERDASGDTWLVFTDAMTGRVATTTGLADLRELAATVVRDARGTRRVKLERDARGKVEVLGATFLFQLVAAPPEHARPQLPLSVTSTLSQNIDWSLAILVAFSFLAHFGLVGAMYSDWMDPVTGEDHEIGALVDLARTIAVPPDDTAQGAPPASATSATSSAPTSVAKNAPNPSASNANTNASANRARVSESRAMDLAARAEAMRVGLVASASGGTAVEAALNRSDIPPVDLGRAAASPDGATPSASELQFGASGPVRTGTSDLSKVAPTTTAVARVDVADHHAEGPKVEARIEPVGSGIVDNADRTVAGLRGSFRKCYTDGLAKEGAMSGRVVVAAKIGPNGEVSSADIASNTGLSSGVASCLSRVVRNAQFAAPKSGVSATLQIPVSFVQQK